MPKQQREPVTIEELLILSRGGTLESPYSAPREDTDRNNPTKDLTIMGAIRNIRKGGRK